MLEALSVAEQNLECANDNLVLAGAHRAREKRDARQVEGVEKGDQAAS
jgi:hypothetical protein